MSIIFEEDIEFCPTKRINHIDNYRSLDHDNSISFNNDETKKSVSIVVAIELGK